MLNHTNVVYPILKIIRNIKDEETFNDISLSRFHDTLEI